MKRNVIREKQFEDELAVLEPDFSRADDLIRGLEWVLQRDPTIGDLVNSDPPVWFVPALDVFDLPYVIYYTFSSTKVFFLSIRISPTERRDMRL